MSLQLEPKLKKPDTGSPDDKAHYVDKHKLTEAAIMGGKVQALCGVWFEPIRDPNKYPTCEECKHILHIRRNRKNAENN